MNLYYPPNAFTEVSTIRGLKYDCQELSCISGQFCKLIYDLVFGLARIFSSLQSSKCDVLLFLAISAFEVQPLSAEVQEGGVARFACKITANPPATVTWEVNRTSLPLVMDRYVQLHV